MGDADAADIAQEVILRALASSTDVSAYIGPWAVRVATNASLDLLRKRSSFAEPRDTAAARVDSDLKLDLRRALECLPERQRQVMALRHLCDHDERTTADLLGISPGSVKRHVHRAAQALRESPHLIHHAPEKREALPMGDWTDLFTRAVPPPGGWRERPWDHWQLESRSGRVARVAVFDGEPVLDDQGDEVMSGPGFGHEVVKVLPLVIDDQPSPVMPAFESLAGHLGELLNEALEEAHRFGHIWVGDEHLGLVLAARGVADFPALSTLEQAVARFYDGPHAEARLDRVHSRRAGEAYLKDPVPKTFTLPIERRIAREDQLSTQELAVSLLSGEHSLIRHVLAQ